MKKLLCVFFCLLLTALTLVGCGEAERDEWLNKEDGKYKDYDTDNTIPEVSLNLYIVVEDETWNGEGVVIPSDTQGKLGVITQSINTVNNAIKDFTSTNYHTEVNVVYVKASEYDTTVLEAVNAENSDAKAANIVLVNSYTLMQELYATGKICPVDSYLATTKFGRLNTSIPSSLFEASKLETVVDGVSTKKLYTIPNNHTIGDYEYLLLNKNFARELKINETVARSLKSYREAYELIASVAPALYLDRIEDMLTLHRGSYNDRFAYEEQGYYCNVVKNPIADKNEAFCSAFAIVDRNSPNASVDVNERAMEIIYNINMNVELRNLLQYGVAGTNYKLAHDGASIKELLGGSNCYSMNYLYTGNIMNAYLCEEIGWNKEAMENATHQNADSVTLEATMSEGSDNQNAGK